MIAVAVDVPLALRSADGGWWGRLDPSPPGVYEQIPVEIYRANVHAGVFRRFLRRARGFGREYFVDEVWRRGQLRAAAIAKAEPPRIAFVEPPASKKRGCGCGASRA